MPTTTLTTAPATQPQVRARREEPFLGINLESLRDYDRQFMFIDAMKTSRRFGTARTPYDGKAILAPDGWPGDDAGTLVMTEVKNVNGVYHFSATGKCDLSAQPRVRWIGFLKVCAGTCAARSNNITGCWACSGIVT